METRNFFSKTKRKSSNKHETEWDHQLPNRFLYRTTYEVNVQSCVIQKDIKVLKVQSSPLMNGNRANREQNDRGTEDVSNENQNGETTNAQRGAQHFKSLSLLSLSNESSAAMNKSSVSSPNSKEPESNVEKKNAAKKSSNQPPDNLKNSSDLGYLNGESITKEKGLFDNNFIAQKLDCSDEKHTQSHYSPQKRSKDFSHLRLYNHTSTGAQKIDLAGGDHSQQNIESNFSVYDNDFNKEKLVPTKKNADTVYLKWNADNDPFQVNSCNMNSESHNNCYNDSSLGLHCGIFIDKERDLSLSNNFNCQGTCGKHDWISNIPEKGETQNNCMDISESKFKLVYKKQEDALPTKIYSSQRALFKSSKTPKNNTVRDNKNYFTSEFNSDTHSGLGKNSLQFSDDSSVFYYLNNESEVKQKEQPRYIPREHKINTLNNDFDLIKQSEYSSLHNCNERVFSVSSEISCDSKFDEQLRNNVDSYMNNTISESMTNDPASSGTSGDDKSDEQYMNNVNYINITTSDWISNGGVAGLIYDSHPSMKTVYLPDDPINDKFSMVPGASEECGSSGFDIDLLKIERSNIESDAESLSGAGKYLKTEMMQPDGSNSLITDADHDSTSSNTYHSDVDSHSWKTSVSGLVEYFENLNNSKSEIREKKVKNEPLVQNYFNYGDKNQNSSGETKIKRASHKNQNIRKGILMNDQYCNDADNNLHSSQSCLCNHAQTESIDVLNHGKVKDIENCYFVNCPVKNEGSMDRNICESSCIYQLKEPSIVLDNSNTNLPQSRSLNFEIESPKELDGFIEVDNSHKVEGKNQLDDPLQLKQLQLKSSGDLQFEEIHSTTQFSDSETACDNSSEEQKGRCIFYKIINSDNIFEPLVKRNDSQCLTTYDSTQHHVQTPFSSLTCNPRKDDLEYNSSFRRKLDIQISTEEISRYSPASNGTGTVNNRFEPVLIQNRNLSDSTIDSSSLQNNHFDKATEFVKECNENKPFDTNQENFFSWRTVLIIFFVSIFCLFVVSDWSNLMKYLEEFT